MSGKSNLALIGPMGAGKSSIGRLLAIRLQRRFVDLDRMIEEQAGANIPLIFEMEGESGFRRRERDLLAAQLSESGTVIACGGGIVLDADNRAQLKAHAYVIHLEASIEEQLARLARDRTRPLLQTPDRCARLETLAIQRNPLYAETADLTFHAGDCSAAVAAQALADKITTAWQPHTPHD